MTLDFRGQRAVVTGGTRGIGAAIAAELRARGAEVIVTGRRRDVASDEVAQKRAADLELREVSLEDPQDVERLARELEREPVDVLINNAGCTALAPAAELAASEWDRVHSVNLRAPFVLCRTLAPEMARRGYGRIVNVASIYAVVTRAQRAAYSSSKAGLLGLTRTLAVEYAEHDVLINAVAPGFIDTELTRTALSPQELAQRMAEVPMRRLGEPAEIARLVAFLASRANGFVTGQHIVADGGFTLL